MHGAGGQVRVGPATRGVNPGSCHPLLSQVMVGEQGNGLTVPDNAITKSRTAGPVPEFIPGSQLGFEDRPLTVQVSKGDRLEI